MGIIITTIIMTVSCVMHNNNLTDQEIIEKAMERGMIMPENEKESDAEVEKADVVKKDKALDADAKD